MAELVTFPDVEAAIVASVNAEMSTREPGLKAYTRIPPSTSNPSGAEFIIIKVVGGIGGTIVTSTPQITVDGYAKKETRAYELCDLALAIIRAQDGVIRGARGFSYPQNLPDPATSQARYTSTGEVRVWGAVTP